MKNWIFLITFILSINSWMLVSLEYGNAKMSANDSNKLDWDKKYELGIEDIDLQHHYFLNLIKKINELIHHPKFKVYKSRLLSELNAYAQFHFISEENMMLAAGYQDLGNHQRQHKELLTKLTLKENQIKSNPEDEEELKEIVQFLADWFIQHTLKEDKKFADFLSSDKYFVNHNS